jgi:hypothetical protein
MHDFSSQNRKSAASEKCPTSPTKNRKSEASVSTHVFHDIFGEDSATAGAATLMKHVDREVWNIKSKFAAHGGGISQHVPSWVEPTLQVFEDSCCEKRKHFCEGEIGSMGTEKYKATPRYATLNKDFESVCVSEG